jgi:curved DNA-binding protein
MTKPDEFVDFYALLGVDPTCSYRELEAAWHRLAKKFHPDNPDTADVDSFSEIVGAYRVLRDPSSREAYDRQHFPDFRSRAAEASAGFNGLVDEKTAADDADVHYRILLSLYRRRRENPSDPGILQWLLQEKLGCPEAQFEFHIWYLKSKRYIEVTESLALAITIEGIDAVISTSRADHERTLLLAGLQTPQGAKSSPRQ